jgi:hypothetical protein
MSRILLQTTIPESPDDWDVSRFSLLADELRAAGHDVIARNRRIAVATIWCSATSMSSASISCG